MNLVVLPYNLFNFSKKIISALQLLFFNVYFWFYIECGHFDPKAWKNPAWNVYIHVNDTKTNTKKTCTGTIINSNMIVTSHQCLVLDTKRVLLHDVLYIKREMMKNDKVMMDIAKPDCLRVTDSKVYGEHQKEFKVVDVIYNPQYARTSQLQM